MESVDGVSFEHTVAEEGVNASLVTNSWTFNKDGTMEVEFAIKFETDDEGLGLSGQGSAKMTGTYSISDSNFTLTLIEV